MAVTFTLSGGKILSEDPKAGTFYDRSRFGARTKQGIELSFHDALYLLDKQKVEIRSQGKSLDHEAFIKKAVRGRKDFLINHAVFEDLRDRGYVVKTALKFGAAFRVYDKGVKPGEDHAKWVVFPVRERDRLTWQEFSAKNRVAHSTKKRLLIACVDDEGDVTYWEVRWVRP